MIRFPLPRKLILPFLLGTYFVLYFSFAGHFGFYKDVTNEQSFWISGVVLEPYGGLGNQMFRFACAYSLAQEYDVPLYLHYNGNFSDGKRGAKLNDSLAREFVLDKFDIPLPTIITTKELENTSRIVIDDEEILFKTYLKVGKNAPVLLHHIGYCQGETFFIKHKKAIQNMYRSKDNPGTVLKSWLDLTQAKDKESICLHIRWGDYTNLPGWVIPFSYYKNAIAQMKILLGMETLLRFFIFSDSIEFVQKVMANDTEFLMLTAEDDVHYVKEEEQGWPALTSYEQFLLMSSCNHNIIPNSSFGWWAAYLNKNSNKIVIAANFNASIVPTFQGAEPCLKNLIYIKHRYPNGWIVLDP